MRCSSTHTCIKFLLCNIISILTNLIHVTFLARKKHLPTSLSNSCHKFIAHFLLICQPQQSFETVTNKAKLAHCIRFKRRTKHEVQFLFQPTTFSRCRPI